MKNERPINELDRVRQLASLAGDAITDPTARQQIADAALIHGLVNSDRIDLILISAIERFTLASEGALRELTYAIDRENRRRTNTPQPENQQ